MLKDEIIFSERVNLCVRCEVGISRPDTKIIFRHLKLNDVVGLCLL
jgi:hypothetical protein